MGRGKPRGKKLDGRSGFFCGGCMSWNCDPIHQSPYMGAKLDRLREQGLKRCCGQKECVCRKR